MAKNNERWKEKQNIIKNFSYDRADDLMEGTYINTMSKLKSLRDIAEAEGFTDEQLYFDCESDYDSDYIYIKLVGTREETDEENKKRIEDTELRMQEAREREQERVKSNEQAQIAAARRLLVKSGYRVNKVKGA